MVADIHFDYRLALAALEAEWRSSGLTRNIGGPQRVKILAREAEACGAAMRIGVNAGLFPGPAGGK